MGIQAGATPGETAGRWVKLGVGAMFAWEGMRYLDYHSRRMTGTGPISAPLQAYAAVRNTQQHLFAATGIQQTSEYLENLMPGIISSPLSKIIRANVVNRMFRGKSPLGGSFGAGVAQSLGAKVAGLGVAGKALTAAATYTQLTDITESPAHLGAVFRGEVDVPVREGRWWALGTNPFGGGRVTHTRPHLIPTILSHAREIGTFGSEGGYWNQQFGLPVPENFFNLGPLLNPYKAEKAHYKDRPYPLTGPMVGLAGNLPFIGPTFNATIGELIKPTQRWHGVEQEGIGGIGASIGFDPIQGVRHVSDPTGVVERLGKQIDVLKEFLGMPGFLVGALKSGITGDSNFDWSKRQLATAGQMTGMERQLYDMDLGGGLGMTEMLRRLLPHRRRDIEQVNNIRNTMPGWLPGSGSVFPHDQEFFRDFHRGDPMGELKSGEARLPGAGYEALHKLHSGVPGVYDPYDRWKILRDVAPTSQAFRHYDAIVKGWARTASFRSREPNPLAGLPGSRTMSGVVQAVLDGDTIVVNASGRMINVRIAGADAPELAHSAFEAAMPASIGGELAKRRLENEILGQPVMINPRDLDVYGRTVADVQSIGIGGRDVSGELKEAFRTYELTAAQMGDIQGVREHLQSRFEPYPFTHRIFNNLTKDVPRNMRDLTTTSLAGINQAVKQSGKFTMPEKMVGHLWEKMSHVNLPGPLNWPVNKLFAQRDPLEVYRQRMLSGGTFANWETPLESFVKPWVHQTVGMINPSYVPSRVKAQRQATSQLDALEYRRNKMFASYAQAAGNTGAAGVFKRRALNTASGVILSGNQRFARGALARTERGFYDSFAAESDPGRREAILESASPQMGTILKMGWGGDVTAGRAATANLVDSTSAPEGWAGMHPDVSHGVLKAKMAHDHAWDFHELGISQAQNYASEDVFSDAFVVPGPPDLFSASVHARSLGMMQRHGVSTHGLTTVDSLFGPSVNMRLSKDPRKYDHVLQTYGYTPNSQGMRF
jgi:endonuclease YncB( thermonuclease family)